MKPISPERVGFIGLGSQGGPMARRLIEAGCDLSLWARRSDGLAPFRDTNATIVDSVAALAARCSIICLCVVDDAGVESLCEQLLPAMTAGSMLIIHSTIHPDTCRRLQQQAAGFGVGLLDAPVSGGGPAAENGSLTVMVGGDSEDLARAHPLFETFAGLITHLGEVGSAQTAKLINNNLMAANLAMAHAAIEVGSRLGLERNALQALIAASSGRSFAFDVYARMPSPGAFGHGAALLKKDIRLLGELTAADDAFYAQLGNAASAFINTVETDNKDRS